MSNEFPMSAKFPGKCPTCGYHIEKGNQIFYDPDAKIARHQKCPETNYDGTEQKNIFEMWIKRAEATNV